MANVIADYSLQFKVEGSKATVKAMEDIIKKMEKLDKSNELQVKKIDEDNKAIKQQTELFKKEEKQLNKTNSALWKYTKRLLTIGAVIGVVRKAWNLGINFANEGQNIKFMSGASNIGTRDFQKWAYVAKRYGGNEGSVASAMQNIDTQIENAKYGQVPMQEVAARYGITLPSGGSAQDFLKVIAKKMESMDRRSQLAMGRAFGFDDATIRMLQLGLEGLTKELERAESKVAFDNAQIEKADAFKKKLGELKANFHLLEIQVGEKMLPIMIKVINFIQELVNYVGSNLDKWQGNITAFFTPLINLIKLIGQSKLSVAYFEVIGNFISRIIEALTKLFDWLGNADNKIFNFVGGLLYDIFNNPKETVKGAVSATGDFVKGGVKWGLDTLDKTRQNQKDLLDWMINKEAATASSIINNAGVGALGITQDIIINIDGTQSPVETGEETANAITKHRDDAILEASMSVATTEQ